MSHLSVAHGQYGPDTFALVIFSLPVVSSVVCGACRWSQRAAPLQRDQQSVKPAVIIVQ